MHTQRGRVKRIVVALWREQRGSAVVQAAGVALFVAALALAMLNLLDWLQAGLTDSLRCYIGSFDAAGCTGSTDPSDGSVRIPRPDTPQPIAQPAPEQPPSCASASTPAPGRTPGLAAPAPQPSSPSPGVPLPGGCDLRCQIIGFLQGMWEGAWDMLSGLWGLGKDIVLLVLGDEETWARYQQLIAAFMRDPVAVAKALLGALAEPIIADWERGCYGKATGRLLFEVLTTVGGTKGLDKLAKLGLLDELGDAGKVLRRIPCLGAAPVSKAPGLAKPVANVCDDLLKNGRKVQGFFPEKAGPNEVLYRVNPQTNRVSHYQVYDQKGLPVKRVDLEGREHGGVPTPHVLEFTRNINPRTGEEFVGKPRTVRPARPDEIPTKTP